MPTPLKLTNGAIPCVVFPVAGSNKLQPKTIFRASPPFRVSKPNNIFVSRNPSIRQCLNNAEISANDPLKSENGFSNHETEGSMEKNENHKKHPRKSIEVLDKLRRYGVSGILSYGLLNTVYYLTTFLVVWFYIAPPPAKMGYVAAAGRFLKIMATVWAGSQVTKLARAAGALAMAPFVDRGLSWFTVKYNFKSQGKAVVAIVGFCLGLSLLLFIAVTLLSA
ncbi:uncharacterized protein LOC111795864 isoform X2 [Cucurbita pepo subsp. pepo]|uniref:uncharacterized protein LOC111795864 isoform X2 n=1 Tax=Cucurbita pepo subsp. pepo TaxID=3664 RepID=UPI000C9D56BB|nr:uncharacterized protein LOC111795864 isoform X2 [Cucurbita pepo subsp. pepo]